MKKILLICYCLFALPVLAANDLSGYIYGKAMMGDLEGLMILRNQGYSLEATDGNGNTAYCLAVFRRNQTAIHTLEQAGVNVQPRCMRTIPVVTEAMIYAAAHDRNVQQISLWQKYGVPVDLVDPLNQNTALCEAVYRKDCPAIDILLKAGASEYHNCMRRVPQKVRQELDCKPVIIDWERIGLTALGVGLIGGGLAVMLSGGGSSGSSCEIYQHWDGKQCVTCPDGQCWDGYSCRRAHEGEYIDPKTNRCFQIAPPPYTDGTYTDGNFETDEYHAGRFLEAINASSAYAHGYSGYIVSRWNSENQMSYFGALSNGQSSTKGEALDITNNRYQVGILSTGTEIKNTPQMEGDSIVTDSNGNTVYDRYVNKDLAYQETDEEGNTVWKGNLAQNSGSLFGYNFDYGYIGYRTDNTGSQSWYVDADTHQITIAEEHLEDRAALKDNVASYYSGSIFYFTGSGDDETVYLVLKGGDCPNGKLCGLAYVKHDGVGSALPYRLVDLTDCGSSGVTCLAPPTDIDSYDYTAGYSYSLGDPSPHYKVVKSGDPGSEFRSWNQGTMLAGIVAAIRNDKGMHGVAYNAEVIPAVADIFRPVTSKAIDQLIVGGADIILQDIIFKGANFPSASVIASKTIAEIYGADTAAAYSKLLPIKSGNNIVRDGIIYVVGTGTDGHNTVSDNIVYTSGVAYQKEASISAMAPLASDGAALSKLFLSVTAVEPIIPSNSEEVPPYNGYILTSYAQPCGSTGSYCLSAPGGTGNSGTSLYSTVVTEVGTGGVSEYNWGEDHGTSAAAAVVAGAAALLKGAYPHLVAEEIVELLKQTATPLGACAGGGSASTNGDVCHYPNGDDQQGYSTFYGWGLINLDKATQPVGALWVHDGFTSKINPYIGKYQISGSSLNLSLGIGQSLVNALPSYFTAFDSFNRPFAINTKPLLNIQSKRREFDDDFKAFMHGRDVTRVEANDQFSMTYAPRSSYRFSAMKAGLMEMNVDLGKTNFDFYYTEDTLNSRGHYFERPLNNPFIQIQEAYGAEAKYNLTSKLTVGMSYATGKNGFLGDGDKHYKAPENRVSMVATEAHYQAGKSVMFKASYGVMKEQESVLGMTGAGAFKLKGANTNFASAAVEIKPSEKFKLNLAYTYGWTTPEKSGSLMELSRLTADGFAAVAQYDLGSDNMVGFSVSSPLRVRSGKVSFNLPVGRSPTDDIIYRETFTGSMKPTARELDFALFYKDDLTRAVTIQGELGLRLHPDHQKEASPDYRAMFGLKWNY